MEFDSIFYFFCFSLSFALFHFFHSSFSHFIFSFSIFEFVAECIELMMIFVVDVLHVCYILWFGFCPATRQCARFAQLVTINVVILITLFLIELRTKWWLSSELSSYMRRLNEPLNSTDNIMRFEHKNNQLTLHDVHFQTKNQTEKKQTFKIAWFLGWNFFLSHQLWLIHLGEIFHLHELIKDIEH